MNTTSRIGKIARLPHSIREQLNLKLLDGQPAKKVLPWLNSLPETKAILADFDHHPITKQNLSDWKQGGHRDWLLQYNASTFLLDSSSFSSSSSSSSSSSVLSESPNQPDAPASVTQHATRNTEDASRLTAKLLLWTQLQYISMARHIDSETDPDRKWNALRHFANDISRLRRSSLADDYLQIQREWLALSQSNSADKKEKEFWKWTERPDINKKLFPDRRKGLTPEQLYQSDPDYDPDRPLPDTRVRLAGMPFEELFPTIPDKPLTQTHPELDDAEPDDSDDGSSNDNGTPSGSPQPKRQPESPSANPSPASHHSPAPSLHSPPSPGESSPVQPNPTTPPPDPM